MRIRSVLFVGQRNAARSIMAETCFNAASIAGWRAFSAGWRTQHRIDRMTIQVLENRGFPVDTLYSKPVDIFRQPGAPEIDLYVFLDRRLPHAETYPGAKEYWSVENPYCEGGRQAYRNALDGIAGKISALVLSGRLVELPGKRRAAG